MCVGCGRVDSHPPPPFSSHSPVFPTFQPSLHSPDVLPPDVMDELARLQDKIKNFSTPEARAMIEADLGASIDELFSEFSAQPIAAASLAQVSTASATQTDACDACKQGVCGPASLTLPPFHPFLRTQVYRARVRATGEEVAVKVQRPGALSTISKVRKWRVCGDGGAATFGWPPAARPFATPLDSHAPHPLPGLVRFAPRGWRL